MVSENNFNKKNSVHLRPPPNLALLINLITLLLSKILTQKMLKFWLHTLILMKYQTSTKITREKQVFLFFPYKSTRTE